MASDPFFRLSYNGTNITEAIAPYLLTIDFTDKKEGESDELTVTLRNDDLRWLDSWFPGTGDRLTLRLGYKGGQQLGPVTFEIDEPEFSGTPDIIRLKGLATPITASLRQKNTRAYEETTLRAIAQQIADTHSLELIGEVPEFPIERVTQRNQTDLQFLRDQAIDYGLIFKVESAERLVFYRESELEAAGAIATFRLNQIKSYRLRKGAVGTYQSCSVRYLNPSTGEYDEVTINANGSEVATPTDGETDIASGDVLKIRERFESRSQAETKATEALRRANRGQIEAHIDVEGDPTLSAGTNINLRGLKRLSGKYQIESVGHAFQANAGYRSNVKLVGLELNSDEAE